MTATIIDGKEFAAPVRGEVGVHVVRLKADHGITPGLAVVLAVGGGSQVYVRSNEKMALEVSMKSVDRKLGVNSGADLLAAMEQLNNDPEIHGILCQLPLPKRLDEDLFSTTFHPPRMRLVSYLQCGFARDGAEINGALNPPGLFDYAARSPWVDFYDKRCYRWVLECCEQTYGVVVVEQQCNGDNCA